MEPNPTRHLYLTLDFEEDLGTANPGSTFYCHAHSADFVRFVREKDLRVTLFVTGEILATQPQLLEPYLPHPQHFRFELHAYNHRVAFDGPQARLENMQQGFEAYQAWFGHLPSFYRAPNGMLSRLEFTWLLEQGIKGDCSMFPTRFPGRFDWRHIPREPFAIAGHDFVELPYAVSRFGQVPISLSYHQLLGRRTMRLLQQGKQMPELIFGFHLHDLFPEAWKQHLRLTPGLRLAYALTRGGWKVFEQLVQRYQEQGYQFAFLEAYHARLDRTKLPTLSLETLFA
ncbi:MAG: polysaccharide deacetylase family protein [Bacteroidota bacterium]